MIGESRGRGYDAVVLAGGSARRLGGADKPGLRVGDSTLIERVAAAVCDAGRLVIVGPARAGLDAAIVTREDPPGGGPVPALAAGLVHVRAPWVAMLAADLPFLGPAHVTALREAATDGSGAVLVDGGGHEQWTAGVWPVAVLRDALGGYGGGSLRGLLAPLSPRRVSVPVTPGAPPPWLDCDTLDDVERAREWA